MKKRRAVLYFVFVSFLCFEWSMAGTSGDILSEFRALIDSNNHDALQSLCEQHDDLILHEAHKTFFEKELLTSLKSGETQVAQLLIKNGVCGENLYVPIASCFAFPLCKKDLSELLEIFKQAVKTQIEKIIKNRAYECHFITEGFLLSLFPPYNDYNDTPFGCTFEHMSATNFQFFCLCFIHAGFAGYVDFFKNFLENRWVFNFDEEDENFLWHVVFQVAQHYDHQELLSLFI